MGVTDPKSFQNSSQNGKIRQKYPILPNISYNNWVINLIIRVDNHLVLSPTTRMTWNSKNGKKRPKYQIASKNHQKRQKLIH